MMYLRAPFQAMNEFFGKHLILTIIVVNLVPILALAYLIFSGMLSQISWFTWALFIVSYSVVFLGVTAGYHRYWTHRSFSTNSVIQIILTALGCMAFQGPPSSWVGVHRKHHIYVETEKDPHTPFKNNQVNKESFWHAHIGWMLIEQEWKQYARDLEGNKILAFFDEYFLLIAILGLFIPAVINGLFYLSWYHFWEGFLLCGILRVFLQIHVAWAVNSVGHIWGKYHFKTSDNSRNNALIGILALGEGWHNGHHAFPNSAKHGLLWWQIDVSYLFIRLLGLLGLAKDIKVPSSSKIQEKLIQADLK